MKQLLITSLIVLTITHFFGQKTSYTQSIRGIVLDIDTDKPIEGVMIVVENQGNELTGPTDAGGEFEITNVHVGKHTVHAFLIGYKPVTISDVEVGSGKQTSLEIRMDILCDELGEVVIVANKDKNKPQNDMASGSVRSFSVDDTEKYAGSLGDPSRMAANFAGVMSVSDQRNDIIIRGNAPIGLLWRLEGVNIPNPNHFGALGTTGGPVSILNNNLLTNSDFFTGAFPAEYGNAVSGVFDLNLRKGNNQKKEYVFQVGFNGFEIGAEGPFTKRSKASYLINFRYSTMEVMDKLGFNDGTGASVPQYKDISFNLNFPLKKGNLSIFGIGGLSYIELIDKDTTESSYGTSGTNTYFGSNMGVTGITYTRFLNNNTKFHSNLAYTISNSGTKLDSLDENRDPYPFYRNNFTESKISYSLDFKKRFSKKSNLVSGIDLDYFMIAFSDSVKRSTGINPIPDDAFLIITDNDDAFFLLQAFSQWKYKISDNMYFLTGIHYQQASINNDFSIEPRVSLQWEIAPKHKISFSGGMHSMLQPHMLYYIKTETQPGVYIETNSKLEFTKSDQLVLSYSWFPIDLFHIKLESYYQILRNAPVCENYQWYSGLNEGAGFGISSIDSLVNEGTGKNYGLELTIEKYFSKNWYFLINSSLYESKYKGYDGIERNSVFNGNYVFNGLFGKEFKIGKNNILELNVRGVYAGGQRKAPVNLEKSILEGHEVIDFDHLFEERYDNYIKFDLRISFKNNRKKASHEWALDLQNFTNNKNVFRQFYNPVEEIIQTDYQNGIYPMFLYRFRF